MNTIASPIISADAAKLLIDLPDVVMVDARGGPDAAERYQAGHISDAIFLNLETDLSNKPSDPARGGRHPLPDPATFGARLGAVAISPTDHLLVYDDKGGANAAARFWWMMKAAGHDSIQVVDGGLTALQQAGLPVAIGPAISPHPKDPYPVNSWQLPLADMEEVERARQDKDRRVVDVREHYRFIGASEPIDLVAGHIPGAVNIPFSTNLEDDGTFRPPQNLAEHFRKLTSNREGEALIVHCGSGVTA